MDSFYSKINRSLVGLGKDDYGFVMGYADKLRRLCVFRGFDRSGLAERAGLSRSSMSRILSGSQEPKLGVAFRLARILGVSLDYLADDSLESEPENVLAQLTSDELTLLKLVRRMGCEAAMDRLLGLQGSETAASHEDVG